MKKYLALLVVVGSFFYAIAEGSPIQEQEPYGSAGPLLALTLYGLVNIVPANIEYYRHKENETSYLSIYCFGFFLEKY